MRNKLSFVLILLMFSSVFNSFADETPYMNLNSKKPIKKIKVKIVHYDENDIISKDKYIYYFSKDKKKIERPSKGQFIDYFYFLFNSRNLEEFIINLDGRYKTKSKKIYKNGLLIHEKHFYDKKLEAETNYKYDSLNHLIEKYYFKIDSSYCKKNNYEYKNDKLYREIKITCYNDDSNLSKMLRFIREPSKITKEYDDKGNIISQKTYSLNDTLKSEVIYKYIDTLLVEEISKGNDECDYREVINYNQNGKILERKKFKCDTITYSETNIYDNNGNLIENKYNIGDIDYGKEVYEYNKDNIIQSKKGEYYCTRGEFYTINRIDSRFDKNGNEIESIYGDCYGNLIFKYIMKYNKWNNLEEMIVISGNNRYTYKYTYKYSYWD